jgi:signal transduction histidine kinase
MGQNLEIQKQKEAIEQQNITLENQAKQLKAQDELKTNFFSNISHEFRTPLTLILGPLQSLQEKTIDQSQKEQFKLIQRNALRLQQLINQLLDISRIEKGFVGLKLTKDDICEYIRYLVSSFHSHAIDRNINLTLETSTPNFIALFDKDKVEKIFFNLLSNAFKYTPNGGSIEVTLTITDKIALSIADTGIGIAKEKIPYIFDKYYQADSTVVKTYESTGIGLALTKELVDIHLEQSTLIAGQEKDQPSPLKFH